MAKDPMTPCAILAEFRTWSPGQWRATAIAAVVSFLVMGVAGETLPGASYGRIVPVEWWNYLTLLVSPLLIGLIVGSYADASGIGGRFGGAKSGAGAGALIGTAAMACPACSPLAIPLFGAAGVLSFLAPERWLIALLSVLLLLAVLVIRLRSRRVCAVVPTTTDVGAEEPVHSS